MLSHFEPEGTFSPALEKETTTLSLITVSLFVAIVLSGAPILCPPRGGQGEENYSEIEPCLPPLLSLGCHPSELAKRGVGKELTLEGARFIHQPGSCQATDAALKGVIEDGVMEGLLTKVWGRLRAPPRAMKQQGDNSEGELWPPQACRTRRVGTRESLSMGEACLTAAAPQTDTALPKCNAAGREQGRPLPAPTSLPFLSSCQYPLPAEPMRSSKAGELWFAKMSMS